jgi:iron(III) transport system ATP-binding protein
MIFQEASLFPHLTVGDNILLAMRHIKQKKRNARLEELLIKGGISQLRDSFPHQISGGQQQRVALARALAYDPHILLMDEPFSHLDFKQRQHIRDNTLHLLKQSLSTVFMVTHDPEEAMYIADTIALLSPSGQLAQFGDPHFLYYNPLSNYVASFFGEVNTIIGHVHNHSFSSAIGTMPCPQLQNGEATLIVRPEALQLIPAHTSTIKPSIGQVMTARFQGRSSLIHLASITETGQPLHLHAKVPGLYLPPHGSFHHISFDHSLAFLFPQKSNS